MQVTADSDDEMSEGSEAAAAEQHTEDWQVPPHMLAAPQGRLPEQACLQPLSDERLLTDPEASLDDVDAPDALLALGPGLARVQAMLRVLHLQARPCHGVHMCQRNASAGDASQPALPRQVQRACLHAPAGL